MRTHCSISILLAILPLNNRAEEQSRIVYEIKRLLRQIQHYEVEIQPHHTTKTKTQKSKSIKCI